MKRPALIASAGIVLVALGLWWWLQRLEPVDTPVAPQSVSTPVPVAVPSSPLDTPQIQAPTAPSAASAGRAVLAGITRGRHEVVAGAQVNLRSLSGSIASTVSGADGVFRVEVDPGDWRVASVEHDEWALTKQSPELHVAAGGVVDGIELELERKFDQRGIVLDDTEAPVANALVMGVVRTGSDGRFVYRGPGIRTVSIRYLEDLSELPNVLTVEHPCCVEEFSVERERGELVIHLMRKVPRAGTLNGEVVDPNRVPLAGVDVRVSARTDAGESVTIHSQTDATGRFSFGVMELQGTVTAKYQHGNSEASAPYEVGRFVTLVLEPLVMPHLRGRVVDASGAPVTRFLVQARPGLTRERELRTADGRFDLELVPAATLVTFRTPTSNEPQASTMALLNRGDVELGDVVLPAPELTVTLEVFDEKSNAPLATVSVEGREYRGRTDAQGRLTVEVVSTPTELRFSKRGYVHRQVPIAKGATLVRVGLTLEGEDGGHGVEFEGVGMVPTDWRPNASRGVWISEVHPTGPAHAAGVLPGDQLLAVDDVPSSSVPLEELTQRIKGPAGTKVKLTFKRDGRVFDVWVERQRLRW